MTKRVSINTDQITIDDAWDYYQNTRDSIIQAAELTKRNMLHHPTAFDSKFFALSAEEVDDYVEEMLDETDKQACLFLIASAEADLRVDFFQRVYERRRDDVSQEFRTTYRSKRNHNKAKVAFDEDILATWAEKVPQSKSRIAELRGAMGYRHWLAHGRWWVPKLGRKYDPAGILLIITRFFREIGLSSK